MINVIYFNLHSGNRTEEHYREVYGRKAAVYGKRVMGFDMANSAYPEGDLTHSQSLLSAPVPASYNTPFEGWFRVGAPLSYFHVLLKFSTLL